MRRTCVLLYHTQIVQLKGDLDKAKEGRRQALDEAASLRMQLEQQLEAAAAQEEELGGVSRGLGGSMDEYQTETVPVLREKVGGTVLYCVHILHHSEACLYITELLLCPKL